MSETGRRQAPLAAHGDMLPPSRCARRKLFCPKRPCGKFVLVSLNRANRRLILYWDYPDGGLNGIEKDYAADRRPSENAIGWFTVRGGGPCHMHRRDGQKCAGTRSSDGTKQCCAFGVTICHHAQARYIAARHIDRSSAAQASDDPCDQTGRPNGSLKDRRFSGVNSCAIGLAGRRTSTQCVGVPRYHCFRKLTPADPPITVWP